MRESDEVRAAVLDKIVHMHWSVGVPDDEVITLQQRWDVV